MPTATYPSALPQTPQFSGYRENLQDNLVRNQTGVGPPKTRPRSTAPRLTIKWVMTLTDSQKSTLDTFFKTTLSSGSLEYQHQLATDSSTQAIYKFLKPPSYTSIGGGKWQASLDLMIVRTV